MGKQEGDSDVMRSSKSKNRNRCSSIPIVSLLLLISLIFLILFISKAVDASGLDLHKHPQSYVLQKLKSHDIIFLGTTHKKGAILKFAAGLIPHLHKTGTTHLGLEISSDQQDKIDSFVQTGNGLDDIEVLPQIDGPEYRSLFTTIRSLDKSKRLTVVALDLPRSMYQGKINRDEWMARSIAKIFHRNPNAKVLVMVGNLHVLKKIERENRESNPRGPIRSYLNVLTPQRSMFSIGQRIDESSNECDFTNAFSHLEGAVAMDCDRRFAGWRIGFMASGPTKPIEACDVLDGVIVY